MAVKYLRQLKTGTIYNYTDILAKRRDMVPYDSDQAKARIVALKNMLEHRKPTIAEGTAVSKEAEAIKVEAAELAGLEKQLEATEAAEEKAIEDAALPPGSKKLNDDTPIKPEDTAEIFTQETLSKDPKYQKACGMKSRNEVEEYMLVEFGQEIDISRPFKDLKEYAIQQTRKRILEG